MQLQSLRPSNRFWVDWWLMNHCSWQCSYCHDIIRSGSIDLPYVKDCQRFIDQALAHAARLGRKTFINFTGGEVTEWADFDQLLSYAHSQGVETAFRTNANLDPQRWQTLTAMANKITMEAHPQHTSTAKFVYNLGLALDQGCDVAVNINMLPEAWDEFTRMETMIRERWPRVRINRRMLFEDPVFNTKPKDYSQEQVQSLMNQKGDLELDTGTEVVRTDYQTMVFLDRNDFRGWQCSAGLEQCVVDAWGRVYRSHCRKNGFMGNLKDPQLFWYEEPMTCSVERCRNSFDILATKTKN